MSKGSYDIPKASEEGRLVLRNSHGPLSGGTRVTLAAPRNPSKHVFTVQAEIGVMDWKKEVKRVITLVDVHKDDLVIRRRAS